MDLDKFFAYDSFRPGQRELAAKIYEQCRAGGMVLAEAMSGFGKTAAVLCGTIAAAQEAHRRVVYTCRTKRQIHRVVEEISELQKRLPIRASSLHSKFDYCLLKRGVSRSISREAFGWYCGFNVSNNLCSYFLNLTLLGQEIDRAVSDIEARIPQHSELLRASESIHVCPYELVRLAAQEAEVVVAPYHYVLDPASKPVLFDKNGIDPHNTILVIDEAHNIRDFMRATRSSRITFGELDGAIHEANLLLLEEAAASLRTLRDEIATFVAGTTGWYVDRDLLIRRIAENQGEIWLQNLALTLNSCSEAVWKSVTYEKRLPSAALRVSDFLIRLLSSEGCVLAKWNDTLGLIDPDPTRAFPGFVNTFNGTVLLSATVNPSPIFLRSLSLDRGSLAVYESTTRSLVHVLTLIDTGVTTRYRERTPHMFSKIASKISSVASAVESGIGVFLPSYAILDAVAEMTSRRLPERRIVKERRGMSPEDAIETVSAFESERGSVLFAVQGGRFSEGEDFRGDVMDAVLVVGFSLPPPSPMLYAEYACLKRAGEPDSFMMISRLPALRKAFQAAGRHIRDPGKRALVVLLDERFNSRSVRELMPSWLRADIRSGDFSPEQISSAVDDLFASSHPT